jgi:hypothetical protein
MSACPWDGGYLFYRQSDFLVFFRKIAVELAFRDPAHDVDCTSSVSACAYDPRIQQLSPGDIHYSNSLGEFVAPDGQPYVWDYEPPENVWLTADQSSSPLTYSLIGARHQVCWSSMGWSCNCGG